MWASGATFVTLHWRELHQAESLMSGLCSKRRSVLYAVASYRPGPCPGPGTGPGAPPLSPETQELCALRSHPRLPAISPVKVPFIVNI